jgi:LPS export ABC transporter protein LptC
LTSRTTCFVLVLGLGWNLGCKPKSPVTADALTMPGAGAPSQVLKDFQMQDILDGVKTMVVDSIQGRLVDKDQIAEVDRPVVSFFKEGVLSSVLHAPQGRVQMNTHEVWAWGGVTVVSSDSSTLTTERLRYDPKSQHLLTDDPVHLDKPDSITDGVGMDAEPDLSHVKIGHEKVQLKHAQS